MLAELPFIGYIRVSSEDQARSGLSLESQEEKVRAMATVKGIQLCDVVSDEGESAKSLDRPGLQRILELVGTRKIGGIIIAKLDRLSRRVQDFGELMDTFEAKGVTLISCVETVDTSTAAGRMCLNVSMSFAQFEREVICERTRDALQAKLKRGEACGNVAYGYQRGEDGKAVLEPNEQRIIAVIRARRSDGVTYQKIADQLNERGELTRSGDQWKPQYIYNIAKRLEA